MAGSAHRQEIRATTPPKGGVKTQSDTSPDGARVDYKAMQAAEAAKAKTRGGKGVTGDSGSEILDYQCPHTGC